MIDLPPQLILPDHYVAKRPAIIRAHQGEIDGLWQLGRERGFRAILPGMVPVVVNPVAPKPFSDSGFIQGYSSPSTSGSYNNIFANCSLGAADIGRVVLVAFFGFGNGVDRTVTGVTIAGVSATIVANVRRNQADDLIVGFALAAVPWGVTGDIVVTSSTGYLSLARIAVYAIYGRAGSTDYHDNGGATFGSGSSHTASAGIDTISGGLVFGAWSLNGNVSASLGGTAGITVEDLMLSAAGFSVVCGMNSGTATAAGRSISVSLSGSAPAADARLSIAPP